MAYRVFGGGCRALMAAEPSAASAFTKTPSSRSKRSSKVDPVSPALAAFLGGPQVSRNSAVKKAWRFVRRLSLQNPSSLRELCSDEKLKALFPGKANVGLRDIAKLLASHLEKTG